MPLPAQAEVRSRTRVTRVVDKGAGKGALVVTAREISDAGSGQPLATVEHVSFCRADGGFGAGDEPPPALPAPPERAPDESVLLPTLPQQALLYRLNGDLNPVHAVPRMAREAGFDRPILHGLCTYGMAAARWRGPAARAASAWPASPRAFPRRSFRRNAARGHLARRRAAAVPRLGAGARRGGAEQRRGGAGGMNEETRNIPPIVAYARQMPDRVAYRMLPRARP